MGRRFGLLLAISTMLATGRGARADLLEGLPRLGSGRPGLASSYDRSGGNGDARGLGPGETLVLADLKGPATIKHLWMTNLGGDLRALALLMYWDGESDPSVAVPLGDFFGAGHGIAKEFASQVLTIAPARSFNCYFPMPFNRSGRIEVRNDGPPVMALFWHVDYERQDRPQKGIGYFHARWHRENPTRAVAHSESKGKNVEGKENYVILEAEGRGHYVGCVLSVHQLGFWWWGEGDHMIFIDGEKTPSMNGTGSEEYFGAAWGFQREYQYPYNGCILLGREGTEYAGKTVAYRFHLPDPVRFRKSIRVTLEHGTANDQSNDYSSVAYWYQTEPHRPWSPLPPVEARLPRPTLRPEHVAGALEAEDLGWARVENGKAEVRRGFQFAFWSGWAMLEFRPERLPARVGLRVAVEKPGRYEVKAGLKEGRNMGRFQLVVDGEEVGGPVDAYGPDSPFMKERGLGEVMLSEGEHEFAFVVEGKNEESRGALLGLDYLLVSKVPL
jgi:hypothetical protein